MTWFEYLHQTSDVFGMFGVFLLLLAYFLLSTNRLSATEMRYQLLNLVGALCILYSLVFDFNLASMILELTWISISLIGIYNIRKNQKN